ncbi:MAG: DUF624 domain-containing protein [Ruminococcus sp.]|nr:DUF624 domain-containing protein [Ruminococcus sp.]
MAYGNSFNPRGLARPPKEKKGIFKFFEIYGRKMWKLMELNIIYALTFIPLTLGWWLVGTFDSYAPLSLGIITAIAFGPSTTAMTKVCRNFSQERNSFVLSDYIETFKKCFTQSLIMGIIDVIFIAGFSVAIPAYMTWAEQDQMMYIPFVLTISFLIVFFMMHFYIYIMIASTNLSLIKILRNAFFLVPLGLKNSIYTLLNWVLIITIILFLYPYTIFIIPFWPLSFLCFVDCFNCYPVIRKFVIQPYYDARGEDNPEFDYLKKKEDEDVFADHPDLDKPVEKKSNKRKGKTIS